MNMDINKLLMHTMHRGKVWDWVEIYNLTGKTPTQIIESYPKDSLGNPIFELVDPYFVYPFSHKNYIPTSDDYFLDNYLDYTKFEIEYDTFGVGQKFLNAKTHPKWAYYYQNDDWFHKTKWLAKNGSIILTIPGIQKVYLACSVASHISHSQSDLDLMIKVKPGFVWISKIYLAIISKIIKYYNFDFVKGFWLLVTRKNKELEILKHTTLENKIKIDFGLVFESWSDVEVHYPDKERNFFVWNHQELNPEYNITEGNSIAYFQPRIVKVVSFFARIVEWIFLPIVYLVSIIHYQDQLSKNSSNINMVIQKNIYSQYNKIY